MGGAGKNNKQCHLYLMESPTDTLTVLTSVDDTRTSPDGAGRHADGAARARRGPAEGACETRPLGVRHGGVVRDERALKPMLKAPAPGFRATRTSVNYKLRESALKFCFQFQLAPPYATAHCPGTLPEARHLFAAAAERVIAAGTSAGALYTRPLFGSM